MNKIMLIGNVGKEPVVRYYDHDQAVATFSLATTERGYTLPNGTQVPDRTDWHNIVLYRGLAKIVENTYIRAIRYMLKVASITECMTILKECGVM